MDAILGHDSEEVLRVIAWVRALAMQCYAHTPAAHTPLQGCCAGCEREQGDSNDLQHLQDGEGHDPGLHIL